MTLVRRAVGLSTPFGFERAAGVRGDLADLVVSMRLDDLSIREDEHFIASIGTQPNLPDFIKDALPALLS